MVIDYIFQFIRGNVLVRLLSMVNILLIVPLLIRVLGVESFGYYNYLLSVAVTLSLFLSFGTSEYSTVYVPTQKDKTRSAEIFYTLLGIRLVYLPLFLILCYGVWAINIINLEVEEAYIYWVILCSVVLSGHGFIEIINRFLKINLYYAIRLIFVALNMGAMVFVIYTKQALSVFFPLIVLVNTVHMFFIIYAIHTILTPVKINLSLVKNIAKKSVFLFLNATILWGLTFTDRFFLLQYQNKYELGIYTIIITICSGIATLVLNPIKDLLISFLSLGFRGQDVNTQQKATKAYMAIFPTLVMPFILGFAIYGQPFTIFYGGENFHNAHQYALWVGLGQFLFLFTSFFADKILMHDEHNNKPLFFIYGLVFLVNGVLNMVLIQTLGTIGAAYATFYGLAFGSICVFGVLLYKKLIDFNPLPHFAPWGVLLVVYSAGNVLWQDHYGILATIIYSGISLCLVVGMTLLFPTSRETFTWFQSRLKEKWYTYQTQKK